MGLAFEECLKAEKADKVPVFSVLDTQEEIEAKASPLHCTTPQPLQKLAEEEQQTGEKVPEGLKRKLSWTREHGESKRFRTLPSHELREISDRFSDLTLGSPDCRGEAMQSEAASSWEVPGTISSAAPAAEGLKVAENTAAAVPADQEVKVAENTAAAVPADQEVKVAETANGHKDVEARAFVGRGLLYIHIYIYIVRSCFPINMHILDIKASSFPGLIYIYVFPVTRRSLLLKSFLSPWPDRCNRACGMMPLQERKANSQRREVSKRQSLLQRPRKAREVRDPKLLQAQTRIMQLWSMRMWLNLRPIWMKWGTTQPLLRRLLSLQT